MATTMQGAVIFHESFETDGQGTRYSSTPEFNNNTPDVIGNDHWGRTDGSDIHVLSGYTGIDGSYFWAAEDT
ncbi:MAG: hypothetical protein ACQKBV_12330, partial [Puniceicoccales bacterium]